MARSRRLPVFLVLALAGGFLTQPSRAQQPAPAPIAPQPKATAPASASEPTGAEGALTASPAGSAKEATVGRKSVAVLLTNPMLWPLALCSVVAVGYALERLVALRRGRVVPRDFVARFLERLASGKLDRDRAAELCRANESAVARIFGQVIRYWGQPAAEIRLAISHDTAGELAELKRNVRVLNGTATLAPLLGLLGTVVGMIEAFEAVSSQTGGASKSSMLAHGISLALVATAVGLSIAILSVTAYYYLLNRIDMLVRELDDQTRRVIDLVSGDEPRPSLDRRLVTSANDHVRHEPRPLGRTEPV